MGSILKAANDWSELSVPNAGLARRFDNTVGLGFRAPSVNEMRLRAASVKSEPAVGLRGGD